MKRLDWDRAGPLALFAAAYLLVMLGALWTTERRFPHAGHAVAADAPMGR